MNCTLRTLRRLAGAPVVLLLTACPANDSRSPAPPPGQDSSVVELPVPGADSAPVTVDSAQGPDAEVQVPIPGVALRPFAEGTNWVLTEPLTYRVEDSRDSVVVPVGFVTDFASIPPEWQSLISALGPYVLPAVVHDYLYWEHGCTRAQSDRLFLLAMKEQGVAATQRVPMYGAVAAKGQSAWDGNARDRGNGLPRIVPRDGVRRPEVLESWKHYREYLHSANVRPGPSAAISPRFCAHGGT